MLRFLLILLLVVFGIHLWFDLEHSIYINEIFSLLGFFVYCQQKYYKQIRFNIQNPISVLNWFLIILFLRIVLSLILNNEFNGYVFLRTISIFYSIFIFFLGLYVADKLIINKYLYYPYLILSSLIGRFYAFSFSIILYQGKVNKTFKIFLILATAVLFFRVEDSSTTLVMLLCWVFYFTIEKRKKLLLFIQKKTFSILFIIVLIIISFIYLFYGDTFMNFAYYGYGVFGDEIDGNLYWRLMYWYYTIEHTIQENILIGVGFGTKLFSLKNPLLQGWLHAGEFTKPNAYIEYVLGPHNSLIFLFARTGIIGLTSFILLLSSFLKYFLKNRYVNQRYMYVFIAINIAMVFNVILESPTLSIFYWFNLGLCFGYLNQSINQKSKENSLDYNNNGGVNL